MSSSFLNDIQEKISEIIQNIVSTDITMPSESNIGTSTDEDEEQSASDTDTITVESANPEIQVRIISRKIGCSNSRTLDFINC
jgi:hypothetical protein